MEGRDSSSPRCTQQAGHGHSPFGAYFHQREAGYPLVGNSSIIHAPTAMRRNSPTQALAVISNSNPNLNSRPSPNANSVVPNLNPNAIHNPNSSNYFGAETVAPTPPPPGLIANLGERSPSEPVKRKRGRPRKYAKDVNGVTVNISPSPRPGVSSSLLKKRGLASGKKAQLLALGAAGQNFTPHVLTVSAGEGPWAVCILSANGAISNATLRHAGVSGGAVTYEGRFEILSLSGSFLLTEDGGTRSRTGGLSVSLAGPDGRVIGGGVAGLLMAASPVQVIVGTFFTENRKSVGSGEVTSGIKPPALAPSGTPPSMPIIQQHMRMDGIESMQDHMLGGASGDGEEQSRVFNVMPLQSIDWGGSHFDAETRDDTDPASTSPGVS